MLLLQDRNSNMGNVLIRMVGKKESMKKSCNLLQGTNCLDGQSLIIKKLGFPTFPERGTQLMNSWNVRKRDIVDLQNDDEFRNSFLRGRFVPLLHHFGP